MFRKGELIGALGGDQLREDPRVNPRRANEEGHAASDAAVEAGGRDEQMQVGVRRCGVVGVQLCRQLLNSLASSIQSRDRPPEDVAIVPPIIGQMGTEGILHRGRRQEWPRRLFEVQQQPELDA